MVGMHFCQQDLLGRQRGKVPAFADQFDLGAGRFGPLIVAIHVQAAAETLGGQINAALLSNEGEDGVLLIASIDPHSIRLAVMPAGIERVAQLQQRLHDGLFFTQLTRRDFLHAIIEDVTAAVGPERDRRPVAKPLAYVDMHGHAGRFPGNESPRTERRAFDDGVDLQRCAVHFRRCMWQRPDELPHFLFRVFLVVRAAGLPFGSADFGHRAEKVVHRIPTEAKRGGLRQLARDVAGRIDLLAAMNKLGHQVGGAAIGFAPGLTAGRAINGRVGCCFQFGRAALPAEQIGARGVNERFAMRTE